MALWDTAEPISLDELRAGFAALARYDPVSKVDQPSLMTEASTLEELWKIFESLEELDDCPLIY